MTSRPADPAHHGCEWIVDAAGARPEALRDLVTLQALCADIIEGLALHVAAAPVWKVFDGEGGITGLMLLAESHLTIHTFPETGRVALNLYCCVPRAPWDWERGMAARLGCTSVVVRSVPRTGRGDPP